MKNLDDVLTKKELREPAGEVRRALYSKSHREELRQSVTDVVRGAVDDVYKRVDETSNIDKQKLVDIGWKSFVPTLGRYAEQCRIRQQEGKKPFTFRTKLRFETSKRVSIYLKLRGVIDS